MNEYKLNQLLKEKQDAEEYKSSAVADQNESQERIKNANKIIKQVNKEIESMKTEITVSDHSVLRYMERILGIDTEVYKKDMLSKINKSIINTIGDGEYPFGDHSVIVKNKTIVTIY